MKKEYRYHSYYRVHYGKKKSAIKILRSQNQIVDIFYKDT